MDPRPSDAPVKNDNTQASVSSSSSAGESSCAVPVEGGEKDGKLVEQVQDMALESSSKTEWTTSTASIHLTTNVNNKPAMFEEEEEGELDYDEDEGEIPGVHEDRNGMKNDTDGDKEEGEIEDGDEEEGEEGEILSDDDNKVTVSEKTSQEKRDSTVTETDGPEEGEVIEEGDSSGGQPLRRKICRYFTYGGCTWGMSCRFLHPGLNDKGAYQMLPVPGQYPSPFPKAPVIVPPVRAPEAALVQAHGVLSLPDQDDAQVEDDMAADQMPFIPEVAAPPKKETAWERGLKLAKEIKKAAQKRKEEDADFEEKRMVLGVTAEEDEEENDKENLTRRREMMRARLEKDSMFDEDDARHRRGGDIVSRWRDKKQPSPTQHRDRDRRKRRVNRSPSTSPERDRRSRRRGGEKDKQKGKAKETVRDQDKERTKTTAKEVEKKREEKVKKQKEIKGSDSGKEKPVPEEEKIEAEVTEEKTTDEKEQTSLAVKEEIKSEEKKAEDEGGKKGVQEKGADIEIKPGKEAAKREELNEGGGEEKDKPKAKSLGISSSRLPNDEWMDPWQRTTSPKRHSASSRSSRSRSSSSSSDSSRSSRSRSHSGSESRSTSRSGSRSRSRSVSQTPSRSRSRSGSRSKSRSRSGSLSSASDHSSSSSSNTPSKDVKTAPNKGSEEKGAKQASHKSSESESESNKSKSKSATPVQKSPVKPKTSPDRGPRTPPVEMSVTHTAKDKINRDEYSQAETVQKWQEGQVRQGSPWDRRVENTRPVGDPYSRDRGYHSRRKRSPERRKRSRSPRPRNEDRRRTDEARTRERSSSADSMEHALARPSSPRATRERGGVRRGSSVSSSGSESASSDTGSESEEERHADRTRRAGPEAEQIKQAPIVPLTSGNIRYTGHKDIKLTLNKSVAKTDSKEPSKPLSQHSLPARTEASSTSEKLPAAKKRPRDPSPVSDASNHAKEVVVSLSVAPLQSANKTEKRPADSQVEPATSGKSNNANTSSRREELLRELKAVEDAIARKRARIE